MKQELELIMLPTNEASKLYLGSDKKDRIISMRIMSELGG